MENIKIVYTNTARFSSAVWFNEIRTKVIMLAGLGGIGSYLALFLSRLQPNSLILLDDDTIDKSNLAGQLFKTTDVGKSKVEIVSNMLEQYSNFSNSFAIKKRFTENSTPVPIMICGFDNMIARKTYFNKWLEGENPQLFIDGRLNAENFQILCIKKDDDYNINRYKKEFLFNDYEADEVVCSYKQTTYCAAMIASYMCNLFINYCTNLTGVTERPLPFFTSYDAELMKFNIEY